MMLATIIQHQKSLISLILGGLSCMAKKACFVSRVCFASSTDFSQLTFRILKRKKRLTEYVVVDAREYLSF